MLSQLGPLFKATFRTAEETDTHQYIPHKERDGRRKKQDDREENDSDMWEDSTGVSVDALRTFLINFLNGTAAQTGMATSSSAAQTDKSAPGTPAADKKDNEPPRPVNSMAAKAVGAYQSMADKLEPHHYTPPPIPAEDAPKSDADLLKAGDVRLIHELIADLEALDQRGIETLTIEPADSFLDSLKNAVNGAKSTL